MKVIHSIQKNTFPKSKELNVIISNLYQASSIFKMINEHIVNNGVLCFSYDINHDTLWNVETLINTSFKTLQNNVDTSQVLKHYYIGLYEPLAKAKGTILFLMSHIEDNPKFICNIEVVASVLLNIETLINQAINTINGLTLTYNGGGNE